MKQQADPQYRMEWRLHTVMSSRNIRTATELHRRLEPYDIDITSHQLTRIVAKMPARLNTKVLQALLNILDCEASDLLCRVPTPARKKREGIPKDVLGPPVAFGESDGSAGAGDIDDPSPPAKSSSSARNKSGASGNISPLRKGKK